MKFDTRSKANRRFRDTKLDQRRQLPARRRPRRHAVRGGAIATPAIPRSPSHLHARQRQGFPELSCRRVRKEPRTAASISCRPARGQEEQVYLKYELSEAIVSSYFDQQRRRPPSESFSLNFTKSASSTTRSAASRNRTAKKWDCQEPGLLIPRAAAPSRTAGPSFSQRLARRPAPSRWRNGSRIDVERRRPDRTLAELQQRCAAIPPIPATASFCSSCWR